MLECRLDHGEHLETLRAASFPMRLQPRSLWCIVTSLFLLITNDDGDSFGVCVYCTIRANAIVFEVVYLVAI